MKQPGKSLRQRFNARARRATAVVFTSLALLGGPGCATTDSAKAETTPIEQTVIPVQPLGGLPVTGKLPVLGYDYEVFEENAAGLPPSVLLPTMTQSERRTYYMSRLCFTSGGKPGAEAQQQELFDALDDLSKLTMMGRPLVDLAVESKLKLCALQHLPPGIAAQYLPSLETVVTTHQEPREERALKMAHEILHASQDQRALLAHGYNWDIDSRVRRTLVTEAAAQAVEFLLAFEAHTSGNDTYWTHVQSLGGTTYADKEIYRQMQQAYDSALLGAKTKDEALRAAGKAAFTRVFESENWRNFYLDRELQTYLADVAGRTFVNHDSVGKGFGPADIDFAGALGEARSFTSGATVPDSASLIARSQKMNWAYQVVDIARYEQSKGARDPETVARFNRAVEAGNPYLNIDLKELHDKTSPLVWTGARKYRFIYEAMDEMVTAKPLPLPPLRKAEKPRTPPPSFPSGISP